MKLFSVLSAVTLAASVFAANAQADGFKCQTNDGTVNVKIYNHTHAEAGTRVAAVMVLSDTTVQGGRKTIARFQDVNGVLDSRSSRYEGNVDLRFNDSKRAGENILGTKLGELDVVIANIDFSYEAPVAAGEAVDGSLVLVKRSGARSVHAMSCARYLKGE
jgi:hypothetical protein